MRAHADRGDRAGKWTSGGECGGGEESRRYETLELVSHRTRNQFVIAPTPPLPLLLLLLLLPLLMSPPSSPSLRALADSPARLRANRSIARVTQVERVVGVVAISSFAHSVQPSSHRRAHRT